MGNEVAESLDPDSWEGLRLLGHRMLDDLFSYQESLRDGPVWRRMPESIRRRLAASLPKAPQSPEAVYSDFMDLVLPYVTGQPHPRFWGWACGNGHPMAVLAEMWAAAINSSVVGLDDAGSHIEAQVLSWCKEMLGYPAEASGILLSGSSMANFVGLAVARNERSDGDVKHAGLAGAKRYTVYASCESHSSIERAVQLLGLGVRALRRIPVDYRYRIDLGEVEAAIEKDRAAGRTPLCIVGNAGTVNTGAIDDLPGLADIAARHNTWFHVDGAFGAGAALSPRLCPLVRGMERADSLAFDFHKWMYFPYEAGCVLVKSESAHRAAFGYEADYMTFSSRGLAASGAQRFTEYGPQLSRGFRALKVWMSIKQHGIGKFGRLIEQNAAQARYLADLVEEVADLEIMAPVSLNVVCLRYIGDGNRTSRT